MKNVLAFILAVCCSSAADAFAQSGVRTAPQTPAPRRDVDPAKAAEFDRLNREVVRLHGEGKYDEAMPLAQSALKAGEEAYGESHPRLLGALYNLASVHAGRGKLGETEAALKRALEIYELSPAEHALAASVLDYLGALRFRERDFGEAERYWVRAVGVQEKAFGPEGVGLAKHLYRLAEFYRARGREKAAEPLYMRALRLWLKSPEENRQHVEAATDGYHCAVVNSGRNHAEATEAMSAVHKMVHEAAPKKAATPGGRPVVEGGVLNGKVVAKPQPSYPREARDRRITGAVVVKIVVDRQGRVTEARPMCAHPLLMQAAQQAALNARFTPTLLDGVPVVVSGVITYRFEIR